MFDKPRRIMLIGRMGLDREPLWFSLGRTALSLFSTALLLGVAAAGHAQTTIHVTTTMDGSIPGECTLRDAIRASNTDTAVAGCPAGSADDVIQLQAGATYVLTVVDADGSTDLDIGPGVYVPPPSPASLQIQGHGATIDGNGTGRVLHCLYTSLDLHDLTLTGGSVPGGADPTNLGGGLLIDSFGAAAPGTLTGHDVRVTGNFARNSGGAIMVLSTNAELHDWSISNNMSLFGIGGADISMRDLPLSVSLRDCTISGNAGRGAGGLNFTSRNQSQVAGHWELIGSTVSGNTGRGGAGISMSFRRDEAAIRGTSVTDNVSSTTGGGLIALANAPTSDARVEIINSTFSRNTASEEGGGLHLLGSSGPIDVSIRGSAISDNSARGGGGIVAVGPRLLTYVTQTTISGNRALPTSSAATGVGGGVLNVDSNMVLTSVTMTGNSASGNPAFLQGLGGAVVNVARGLAGTASHLSLLRSEVFGNDASLADGVATVRTHPSFTAETVFGRTSICEEADTCVSNVPLPTSQVSLGNNRESDDRCGFTQPNDDVFVACDAPQPGSLRLDTVDFLPLLDDADSFPLLAGAEDEAMPAGMEALPQVR